MTTRLVNAALFVLLALTWIFIGTAKRDVSLRNFEFMPEMVRSPAHAAQHENPFFAGGAEPLPPQGSIPRGFMPFPYAVTPEDAERAGRELINLFAPEDAAALARGAQVYATFCRVCHGPEGLGDGTVTKNGFPAPPSLLGEKAMAMPDGKMFHVLTHGQNAMPGYAAQISREDRWRAILHVRKLQAPPPAKETPAPPEEAAEEAP
jgi:mono/diheme cytochrome c family protein